jgi:hypothetical protein
MQIKKKMEATGIQYKFQVTDDFLYNEQSLSRMIMIDLRFIKIYITPTYKCVSNSAAGTATKSWTPEGSEFESR